MSNTPQKMMTLKCRHGEGHEWTRPSQRGKPPHYCPEHTPAGADNKTGARKRATRERLPQPKANPALEVMGNGNGAVADGEDISPQELQARMEAEAAKAEAIRIRTEKALATKAAKKAEREAEEAKRRTEAVERMVAQMPTLDERWNAAFDTACKENTREAWNRADAAQMAMLNTRAAIRKGVTV